MNKRHKNAIWRRIANLHWGIKTATAFFAFFVAMGSAAATWDKFGWWKPASIQYVDERVDPLHHRSLDLQLELAEGKRDATDDAIFRLRDMLDRESDQDKKAQYKERIHEKEVILRKQDAQINTLNRMRRNNP